MKSLNYRRWMATGSIFLLMLITIGEFQNCAPAGPASSGSSTSGGEVRIVDDWMQSKVNFVEASVELETNDAQAVVAGFCDRKAVDSPMNWVFYDAGSNSNVLSEGQVFCQSGSFQIELPDVQQLDCDVDYRLLAESENGDQDLIFLRRKCDASLTAGTTNQ